MSAWVEVARFTLTKDWQFTNAVTGKFFRVRHLLGRRVFSGWIAQADISNPAAPTIADVRGLFCKEQADLYEFPAPIAFSSRAIGVKRLDDSLSLWGVAIDVLDFSIEENPNVYEEFSGAAAALMAMLQGRDMVDIVAAIAAHESAQNPHPEYALSTELEAALVSQVTGADLAAAIADRVTVADLAATIADLVTTSALTAAITNFVTSTQLSAALASKSNSITLTTTTTGNALTEMNNPQRVILKPNSTAGYEIHLTGQTMNNSGNPEYIYWIGSGALTRGATAASTVLQTQTAVRRSSSSNGINWSPDLTADTVNGGLKIRVPGFPNKTVKWVASVQLFEVF
jgi:hypothetical protein